MEWKLFADLREAAGEHTVAVDAGPEATVADALDALLEDRPALRERVLEDGALAAHVNVLRNGEALDDLEVPVREGDELALFPPVSGG